jgi:PAS domain S-box-containing protein
MSVAEGTVLSPWAFDICQDAIIAVTRDGQVAHCNKAAGALLGLSRSQLLGQHLQTIIGAFDIGALAALAGPGREAEAGAARRLLLPFGRPGGPHQEIELLVAAPDAASVADGLIWATLRNATERQRIQHIRRRLVDCARLVGRQFIDEAVAVLAESLSVRWVMLCEIEDRARSRARTVAFVADGKREANFSYDLAGTPCGEVTNDQVCFYPSGIQALFPDDTVLSDMGAESYIGAPLHASDGTLLGLLAVLHDGPIAETLQPALTIELFAGRAGAELERLQSVSNAERLGRVVEDAASEAFVFDADTLKFILVNRGARENLGYSMDELRQLTPIDIKPEFTGDQFRAMVAPLRDGSQQVLNFETIHRRKDGTDYNVAVKLQLLQDRERPVFYAAIEDTTERDATLRALKDTSNRLDTILSNTSMAVFMMNDRQECVYMNDAAEQLTGYGFAETQGRALHDVIHHSYPDGRPFPIEECAIDRALPTRAQTQGEEIFVHKDGSFYPVFYSASPILDGSGTAIGTLIEARNIREEIEARQAREHFNSELEARVEQAVAERDAAQAQLFHAQKMEAIGKLTGGVAHDFNNLLQIVGGSLELLARDVEGNHRAQHRVGMAMSGVERGARLAQQLLAFSRRQPLNPRPCNLQRLVSGIEEMLHRTIGEQIQLKVSAPRGLWECLVDEAQIENAILNLAINARDAMPDGGRLLIELGNATVGHDHKGQSGELAAGDYVMIAVTDTGSGIPPDILERIYEPFFTTKEMGKGTGLGLSMVYGLMKQSGGHVTVYSEPGVGTTFKLYLPRTLEREAEKPAPATDEAAGGTERILVVEDDPDVRTTVTGLLRELGYEVLVARDAAAAVAVLESGTEIDLLFTDVVMPGPVSSRDLARHAGELMPEIAILFTSGYTENGIVHSGRLDEGVDLLSKPYSRAVLARRIRQSLDARGRTEASLPEAAAAPEAAEPAGRSMRLLLVEDEPLIAMAASDMIGELGHEVVEAATAKAALQELDRQRFDCILLDLGLPDGRGDDLAETILSRWPEQRIVIVSGYDPDAVSHLQQISERILFLKKPYQKAALQQLLTGMSD